MTVGVVFTLVRSNLLRIYLMPMVLIERNKVGLPNFFWWHLGPKGIILGGET